VEIKTPYPKRGKSSSDIKLTILIVLWVLDKIIMSILIYLLGD